MNALDIIICIIISYCFVRGIFRGIVREFASIIGIFLGLFTAYAYYDFLAGKLACVIISAEYRNVAAFLLIFCAVMLFMGLLGTLIRRMLKAAFIGWLDRLAGSLFGIAKGLLIASVILVALTAFLPQKTSIVRQSVLAPYIVRISSELVALIPNSVYDYFNNNLKELEKTWKQRN